MPLQNTYYIACPYCLEQFEVVVDLPAGSQEYVEDCEVCCQPIVLSITVEEAEIRNIEVHRENE